VGWIFCGFNDARFLIFGCPEQKTRPSFGTGSNSKLFSRNLLDGKILESVPMLCYPLQTRANRYRWDIELGRTIEIAPSILSADFAHLAREIEKVESAGANLVHLDVMDGHFVPNMTIGPPVVASVRKFTQLPLDVHLMIEKPERYLDDFIQAGANWISVHVEADVHLDRTLRYLRENGIRPGVAVNPGTSISLLEEVLPLADHILIMTVNPGFGGQKFIPSSLDKIRRLKEIIASNECQARIEVDGGIGPENLKQVLSAGAEIIVAGSAIFDAHKGASEAVRELKGIAERQMGSLATG
jgi:ribulose-phosphate 3-epimerase